MKKKPKTADEILKWAEEKRKKAAQREQIPFSYKQLSAWQLRRLGYSLAQTAQILNVGITTVKRWDKKVDEDLASMPAVRLAVDAYKTKIPKALEVYDKALECDDIRVAKDAAKDILTTFNVNVDRKEFRRPNDDARKSDDELIAEAERILAGAKRPSDGDNDGAEEA